MSAVLHALPFAQAVSTALLDILSAGMPFSRISLNIWTALHGSGTTHVDQARLVRLVTSALRNAG